MKDFIKILTEELNNETTEGFHTDIETETIENENFRKVLFTAENLQLVVMSLEAGEDIGEETHNKTDQFIRIDKGDGIALIGEKEYGIKDGDAIIVPVGVKHNITAGEKGLKMYTIYSPPEHEDGEVVENKEDDTH